MSKESGFFFGKDAAFTELGGGSRRKVLAYNSHIMIAEVHFDTNGAGAVHSHPHTQCTYVDSGVFEFEIEGEKKIVKAGDSLVFASGEKHGCVCLEEGVLIDVFTPMRDDFIQ
ncbi:MAG: cupin domain-containing protein [Sphaerochaeta sp.]